MKRTILAVLFITLFSISSIIAQPFYGKGNPGQRCLTELKLNDTQQKQFDDFRYEHQQLAIDLRAEISKNRIELRKLMNDNDIDAAKIRELTNENSELRAKIHSSRTDMWLNIYSILDKDQQKIWANNFGRMGKGDGFRKGRGKGRHFGRHGYGAGNPNVQMGRGRAQWN